VTDDSADCNASVRWLARVSISPDEGDAFFILTPQQPRIIIPGRSRTVGRAERRRPSSEGFRHAYERNGEAPAIVGQPFQLFVSAGAVEWLARHRRHEFHSPETFRARRFLA
jgi:hypothetical protein